MNVYFERLGLFSPYLPTLLDLNPRLTHLNLSFELLLIDGVKAALSKLEHLQHLAVHAEGKFDGSETFSLLRACLPLPSLTGLFLDMEWTGCFSEESIPDLETVINEASIARLSRNPTAAKINTLWLPLDLSGDRTTLCRCFSSGLTCWICVPARYHGSLGARIPKRSNRSYENTAPTSRI